MEDHRFDAVARFISRVESRRSLLRQAGAAGFAAIGLTAFSEGAGAQDATPTALVMPDARVAFDALDPETKDAISRALWTTNITPDQIPPDLLEQIIGPKNSNEGFGLRMGARILELLAQPDSFVQSYAVRYEQLTTIAQSLTAHQAYLVSNLIGPEGSRGYSQLPTEADFQFPQRNAIDLQSQIGWYFFVGSATADDGQEYGIELMFFRGALVPPHIATALGISDVENQMVELHFAIAQAGGRHYQAKPILIAGTTGLLTFEQNKLGATMGKNSITSGDGDSIYPIRLQAWGQDDGEIEPVQFSIDLTFTSGKDYLLQGAGGCSPCCDGVGTLYYSVPGLALDPANSSLVLDGQHVRLQAGTFWFDHQWGMLAAVPKSEILRAAGNLTPAAPAGWDWFQAQFTGNHVITAYSLHSNDYRSFYQQTGSTPPGSMTVPLVAKYMDPDEITHTVEGELVIDEWILSVDTPSAEIYPPTYTWYPNKWNFTFGDDVPEEIRVFTMQPIVSTGQSGFFAGGAQYSEGAVYLLGPDGEDLGRGFAESVGYAQTLPNVLRLVGIEPNLENMELFGSNPPQPGLITASQAFVFLNQKALNDTLGMCLGL